MANFTYTKKIIIDNKTVAGVEEHMAATEYQDWLYDQHERGLADPSVIDVPLEMISDTVAEILVTDQAQADSYIAMATALGERIGYPLSVTTVVDYTA